MNLIWCKWDDEDFNGFKMAANSSIRDKWHAQEMIQTTHSTPHPMQYKKISDYRGPKTNFRAPDKLLAAQILSSMM